MSRFWYSAYRDLTVDQIERNHRIANGLRQQALSEEEAADMDARTCERSRPARSGRAGSSRRRHDELTQGLVVSGFAQLPTGRALFLEFGPDGDRRRAAARWLTALAPGSRRSPPPTGRPDARAAALAFTWTGLEQDGA